jgi:hypothetical protein
MDNCVTFQKDYHTLLYAYLNTLNTSSSFKTAAQYFFLFFCKYNKANKCFCSIYLMYLH